MPTYVVTDPTTGRKVKLTGDTPPTDQDLDEIFASLPAPKQAQQKQDYAKSASEVPITGFNGEQIPATPAAPVVEQPTPYQPTGIDAAISSTPVIGGAYEYAKTLTPEPVKDFLSNALAGGADVAQTGGAILSGVGSDILGRVSALAGGGYPANPEKQAEIYDRIVAQNQYIPSREGARNLLSGISETIEPLSQLPPVMGGVIPQMATTAAGKALIPNAIAEITPQTSANKAIAQRITSGETDKDLAGSMVVPESIARGAPRAKSDKVAQEAIKQGFDEGVVQALKQTTPTNRAKLLRMANIAEKSKQDAVFSATNRPADVAGDSLAQRIKAIRDTNIQAGKEIDDVADKVIRNKPVDYETPFSRFVSDIEGAGITIDDGKLNFSGSDLEFSAGDKKLVSDIYSRAIKTDGSDAYKVHKLKRLIDRTVDYGKGSQSGVTSGGESIVKGFRRAVDESLDNAFEDYNKANTKYADTISALAAFQDAAGSKVNLFGENADKALGTVSRRLLSNTQSRVNLMDSIKNIDDVSRKYGQTFDDDIMTQVLFADELDKIFGAAARTSLQGDVGKGVKRGLETASGQKTVSGIAIDATASAVEKLRGINEKNAFRSIKELLAREEAK